jgi:CRP/FNR family transcriptional regulator, cyclic AMP receptor protein
VKTDDLMTRLAATDLFNGLSKRALTRVAKAGREIKHADGHEVIVEGHGAIGFHLITAGTARVTTGDTVRRTLGVGDYFGEISAIDGRPRSASVEAIEKLTTFAIEPAVLNTLIDENPAFARQLLKLLCSRLREAERRVD